jgi:hypothetical protein
MAELELLNRIKSDYKEFIFREGRKYAFRPPKTIIIGPEDDSLSLLHELGHALLKHRSFDTDAKRLRMEREAWEKARELAAFYNVPFDEELMENELDSYRDWLDHKSRCPKCKLTRYQTPDGVYHCPKCEI